MDSKEKMVEMVREWIARGFAEDKKAGRETAAEPDAAYILRCCYGLSCRVKPDMTYTESCLGAQLAYSIKESFDEGLEGEEEGTMPDIGYIECHLQGVWEDIRAGFEVAGGKSDLYDEWEIVMRPRIGRQA